MSTLKHSIEKLNLEKSINHLQKRNWAEKKIENIQS